MRINANIDPVVVYDASKMDGGKIIRDWREGLGWTQNYLANKAGVSQSLVQQFESGWRIPERPRIRLIAQALNKTLDDYDRAVAANAPSSDLSTPSAEIPARIDVAELARHFTSLSQRGAKFMTAQEYLEAPKAAAYHPSANRAKKTDSKPDRGSNQRQT